MYSIILFSRALAKGILFIFPEVMVLEMRFSKLEVISGGALEPS